MIQLIYEPSVYLVGGPQVREEGLQQFLTAHNTTWESDSPIAGERLVEVAGRLCYMSFDKPRPGGNKAYIKHILEVQHGSVLEHAVWNFIITGVSRSLTHELVRHRVGFSYSQLSQRYVDESDVAFVVPPALRGEVKKSVGHLQTMYPDGWNLKDVRIVIRDNHVNEFVLVGLLWIESILEARHKYILIANYLQDQTSEELSITERRKAARETARSVLPNATETKIFVTANARALRHFIDLRATRHADKEIRQLAIALLKILQVEWSHIFGDYQFTPLPDASLVAASPHKKV